MYPYLLLKPLKWFSAIIVFVISLTHLNAQPGAAPFYIIVGESNCGWVPSAAIPPDSAAKFKGVIPQTSIFNPGKGASRASFENLQAGVNTMCENYADPTQFGPEVSLLNCLQKEKHRQRFVYKQGQANTSLVIDWKPVHPYNGGDGTRFNQLEEWLPVAIEQAKRLGYKLDLKGVIYIGGENDSRVGHEGRAKVYFKSMKAFFDGFQILWNGLIKKYELPAGTYKKVICRVNAPGASFPYRGIVRTAQAAFCADKMNNAVMINTDKYPLLDYVHYNAEAQIKLGNDIFTAAQFEHATRK